MTCPGFFKIDFTQSTDTWRNDVNSLDSGHFILFVVSKNRLPRGSSYWYKVGHTQILILIFIPRTLYYTHYPDFIFILYPEINYICDSQALVTGAAASGGSKKSQNAEICWFSSLSDGWSGLRRFKKSQTIMNLQVFCQNSTHHSLFILILVTTHSLYFILKSLYSLSLDCPWPTPTTLSLSFEDEVFVEPLGTDTWSIQSRDQLWLLFG